MFPYNMLILPLAGGYFFIANFYLYKYQRLDTPRVVLNAIIAGIRVSIASFLARISFIQLLPGFYSSVCKFLDRIPFHRNENNQYLWTLMFGFIGAIVLVPIANWIVLLVKSYGEIISDAVDKHGDELEQLFRDSVMKGEILQITLKNEKVYLGFVR